MVTSNKLADKKVVKMEDHNNSAVVPQRTLLGEVNEHITCPLCRGYYIDATTIVECLHSFCRSCIIKHLKAKSYCPVCEMMINSAKPNIKLDKALQDIVYKLVPGLFQKEMERRQTFYASRPGPAATATPEQRGEDTERIIFSPEDVISFSLEYADATDADSISSKSSDSNEPPSNSGSTRRYLQCPAVVNISHLKKFLSMKFDIDSTQFAIDILYKRVPLPDYYTLMDIAYIYNWKRNEPMRFFYQIIDYVAIRNRIFDINRKSTFRDSKATPTLTDDTNASSPAPHLNDHASEASSGTDSPMPEDNTKQTQDNKDNTEENKIAQDELNADKTIKKNDEEVEKSQFLNSFELTAKSNCVPKTSPGKSTAESTPSAESASKTPTKLPKTDEKLTDTLKRKHTTPSNTPELKKLKIEIEKTKITSILSNTAGSNATNTASTSSHQKTSNSPPKDNEPQVVTKNLPGNQSNSGNNITSAAPTNIPNKDTNIKQPSVVSTQLQITDSPGLKRPVVALQNINLKRKPPNDLQSPVQQVQKTISPVKIYVPKLESQLSAQKSSETPTKPPVKKMPDLKPSNPSSQSLQNKGTPVGKVRMDLLANNSDPTIDRSKILSQVKTSMGVQNTASQSGDPLKSLFDSCKINIPSSLSITLTDQKLDPRNIGEQPNVDPKKTVVNKNLAAASNSLAHKVPSPPVHNYIEILKLPDTEPKKPNKPEGGSELKPNVQSKNDPPGALSKPPNKGDSVQTSAKGPIPNLKPIADTKLGKQSTSSAAPITFQQTFEQQLQTLQTDKKSKLPKNKAQVPKLVPATPKSFSAANKPNTLNNKPNTPTENKSSTALDLSSPHNVQGQSGVQQTFDKAKFETMQSIANLANKQSLSTKGIPPSLSQNTAFPSMANRPLPVGMTPLRIPAASNINQIKLDKVLPSGSQIANRHEASNKTHIPKPGSSASPTASSPGYQMSPLVSLGSAQPSPRQTRSPSSSPKLVIAEEKQASNSTEQNINQSNQVTSTQLPSTNSNKTEASTPIAGPSKMGLKPLKAITPTGKITGRQPITPNMKTTQQQQQPQPQQNINNAADYLRSPFITQHALMRHQMEMNAAWLKTAQRQYDFDLFKNMANVTQQGQNDFNNKDKQ